MFRAFRSARAETHEPRNAEEKSLLSSEGVELEKALIAMDAVLDGQIDTASKLMAAGDTLFFQLATGVLRFIEATVSFETEAIYKAVEALSKSEHTAAHVKAKAQSMGIKTTNFRPGAEFELAEYESSLLAAISMLLTESKFEILKALYKIRKTYLSLEDLRKHIKQVQEAGSKPQHFVVDGMDIGEFKTLHLERTQRLKDPEQEKATPTDTIEEYLLSGVNAMSGLLHLILSSVPPNIARLLSVVGLQGDRESALQMMWNTTETYQNIHGSLALIALVMFFDGQLQYKDIQLDAELENKISDKYQTADAKPTKSGRLRTSSNKTTAKLTPRELRDTEHRLMEALAQQRVYYPHGVLWLLQQGRLVTHDNLPRGVAILESKECGPNQMRQVEGLLMFDRTMFLLSLNRFSEASEAFIKLMDVSTWSHPLYMYMAASCELELFRMHPEPQSEEALAHRKKAETYFSKAPNVSGKKKVLGKKMPFDGFVVRKVAHMKEVAKRNNLDLADAIATSPLYEALYFWNGHGRMSPEAAQQAVDQLNYSIRPNALLKESSDDRFTRELLVATYMRRASPEASKDGYAKVRELASKVVSGDVEGTGNKKVNYHAQGEPWAGAACLYENAIYEWNVHGPTHAKNVRRWLTLSADWPDDYELSTRINMKITGARDRLDIYRM